MPDTLDRKALSIAGSVVFSNASDDASWGVQDGAFASVEQQAGIYAGEGGFAIDVDGNTDLVGGVIASEADPASNTLNTGTLTASDIEKYEEWSASQTSLSASLGSGAGRDEDGNQSATSRANASLPGLSTPLGQLTAGAPVSHGDDGAQDGITRSAIAPGTITITSGDTASEQLAATISRDTGSANTGALTQELTDTQRDEIAELEADADTLDAVWGGGGAGNIALTALRGAASGDVTGNLSGLAQATAVNVLQSLATSEVKAIADGLMKGGRETAASETTRAALQALTAAPERSAAARAIAAVRPWAPRPAWSSTTS